GQRMGVLREFRKGPFIWFMSIVDLLPRPGGGTMLRHTVRVQPRGWLGRLAARIELGLKTKKALGAVYRQIDATLSTAKGAAAPMADPFELPTRLTGSRQRRLQSGIDRLLARGTAPQPTDLLGLYLANAPAQELARIRP